MLRKRRVNSLRIYTGLGVALVMLMLAVPWLGAQGASSIAQSFQTDDPNVVAGSLVSLKPGTANTVELATSKNIDRLLGVTGNDSLIELSDGVGTVEIVTTGETITLVSDINGAIKTGDKITASPIAGVGMKAMSSTLVIGTAQADLASVQSETRVVTDKSSKQQTVHIGALPMQVDKVFYEAPQDASTFLPPVLQDFAASVAGHRVSPVRVMIAGILVVLLFVAVTVLLYSAVRSSIISIGRNPLSGSAVQKSLIQVGLTIGSVLIFTALVVYLILTT